MVTLRNSAIPATINHDPVPIRQTQCPRCNNRLQQDFPDMEPECVACGYVDYTFIPKVSVGKSILQSKLSFSPSITDVVKIISPIELNRIIRSFFI